MVNNDSPKKLIESLREQINRHNKLYYVDAMPKYQIENLIIYLSNYHHLKINFLNLNQKRHQLKELEASLLMNLKILNTLSRCKVFQILTTKRS